MKDYTPPVYDYVKVRKSKTVPDQSLSIQEIVKRYVRGIPVDVVQRKGVYLDQQDYDLEKLSRMDFAEKSEYAQALSEQAKAMHTELLETERFKRAKEKEAKDAAQKSAQDKGAERPPA